jgi:hypothetical protein
MRILATVALFLADVAAFAWLARRARRRPLPLSMAVGLGLLVAWQAIVSSGLSVLSAVNGTSLALAACLPPMVAVLVARRDDGGPVAALLRAWKSIRWAFVAPGWQGALNFPLALILAVVAATHAPSNWDSMTYHLARVAHWIQRGSVAPYETSILRQNILAPGAEYVLLGLQAVADSDRLANGLQLFAWILVAWSAMPLARICGAPRRAAAWAGPIVAGAPMLVLQATSTQNDLVAAALALAIVAASLPFLHRTARAGPADALVLGTLMAAGFVVKVTTLLCAAPVVLVALTGSMRSMRSWPLRRTAVVLLGGTAIALGVAGPQLLRMATADARSVALTAPYVFPLVGEWGAREANLLRALTRHLPESANVLADLGGRPSALPLFHEDLAANPVQSSFAMVGIMLLVLGWRRATPRSRWAGAMVLGSWVVFQMTLRSNDWISRLETPLFALLPATMGGWRLVHPPALRQGILAAFAALSLAFGVAAAIHNVSRSAARTLTVREPTEDYYVNRPGQRPMHDAALDAATRIGCRRIGLWIGEDSFDYPLTWRAMQRGIEVRHVTGPDTWPCILVSDRGPPPGGGPEGDGWRPVHLQLSRGKPEGGSVTGGVWIRSPP